MSFLLLFVAFVLTGVNQISNKALIELGLARHTGLYMLGFWGSGIVLGVAMHRITRHGAGRADARVGVMMGVTGALAMIFLMLALRSVSGVVAFPVRSCGNVALTAATSYAIWREDLTPRQWLGVACAVAAIYLLV